MRRLKGIKKRGCGQQKKISTLYKPNSKVKKLFGQYSILRYMSCIISQINLLCIMFKENVMFDFLNTVVSKPYVTPYFSQRQVGTIGRRDKPGHLILSWRYPGN